MDIREPWVHVEGPAGESFYDDPPDDTDPRLLCQQGEGAPSGPGRVRLGSLSRTGEGAGFDAGGVGDWIPPGLALAGLAGRAWEAGLDRLTEAELVGIMLAWRRLASWAAAGELAAVAELSSRRYAQVAAGADEQLARYLPQELAVPLTLTARRADDLLHLATELARLPATRAALKTGLIDRDKARVIGEEVSCLSDPHAEAVEEDVIGRAPGQTTSQLRAAVRRAVLAVDPDGLRRRQEAAREDARVEVWDEPSRPTAALAGRDLPPAEVLAADRHLSSLARELKNAGAEGTMDQLRAKVYTTLLRGQPVHALRPASSPVQPTNDWPVRPTSESPVQPLKDPGSAMAPGHGDSRAPVSIGQPSPATGPGGSVHLTMPLRAWLGASAAPGEVAGFGPVPADDARALASLVAGQPGSRLCLTFTDSAGRAVAHGCARATPGDRALAVTIRPLAAGVCSHERESAGYRPSPSLRHLLEIRQRTCSFPSCRRAAVRCDIDHSLPYAKGGRTCECGCAPLCRRHHQVKQTRGWSLEQPEPGVLVWRLPHGRTYVAEPDPYPDDSGSEQS
jgi:hypothetical protein